VQGTFYNRQIQEKYGAELLAFKSPVEAYPALKAGSCAGFLFDDTLIQAQLLEPEWADYKMALDTILEQPWGIAVKLGEDRLAGTMADTVKAWHKEGLILALEKKHGLANSNFAVEMNKRAAPSQ